MAAVLPLIVGFLAIWITLAIISVLASFTPMSVFVLNMTTMLGLGVGIDYSLLIVTRFREELNRGLRRREAALRALSTAGVAVLTSGLTVVVGFAALLLTPLVETQSVGIGGLVVVAVAVALSTTLLPALLAVLGRQIDRPRWLARRLTWYHAPTAWERWARSLSRHPRRALAIGGASIAILTAPVFWIRIGLPARNWWPDQTEAGQGVKILEAMGVSNLILPVRMVIEAPAGQTAVNATSLRGLRALSDSLRADPRVRAGPEHRGPGARDLDPAVLPALQRPRRGPGEVSGPPGCLPEHATARSPSSTRSSATPPRSPPGWTSRDELAPWHTPHPSNSRAPRSWWAGTPRRTWTCRI